MNLFKPVESFFTLEIGSEEATLTRWRQRAFSLLLSTVAPMAGIIYIASAITLIRQGQWVQFGINTFVFFWILFATYLRKALSHNLRVGMVLVLLYFLGISTALSKATVGDSRIWLVTMAVLAAVFLSGRAGLVVAGLNFISWISLGFLFRIRALPYPYEHLNELIQQDNFSLWFNTGLTAFVAGGVIVLSLAVVLNNLNKTVQRSQDLTNELEEKAEQLQEQTESQIKYSQSLEASARIGRTIATLLDPNRLLYEAARRICTSFDMLHVGIFLLSADNSEVTLRASSGGRGKTVPTLGYRIRLGEGLIDWVIKNAQPYATSVLDEESSPSLRVKLPDTQAHAVMPLQTRDELLGVIVLQSQNPRTFDSNTLTTLQILGDQIATLLSNARLFAERESALQAEKRAYREFTRSAWTDFIQKQTLKGYRQDPEGLKPLEASAARHHQSKDPRAENIPIKVRGQLVGYIEAKKREDAVWTPRDKEVLETVANRLESALDAARLYQETQQRALHDRIVSDVSARMRETLDLETVLKTAAREIQQALNLAEAEIRLGSAPESTEHS